MIHDLDWHQARITALWERLVHILGVHSVNVLLDRAIWQTSQQYPDLLHIQCDDDGPSLDGLEGNRLDYDDDAFNALYDEMLLILARLLGQEMARRLFDELQAERTTDGSDAIQ